MISVVKVSYNILTYTYTRVRDFKYTGHFIFEPSLSMIGGSSIYKKFILYRVNCVVALCPSRV